MIQGIYVKKAVDVNPAYGGDERAIAICLAPIGVVPTNPSATKTAEGSLEDDTYYYKITAVGVNGETVGSVEVNATTSGTDNSVTLTWDDQDDVVFRIYRGLATGVYTHYREVSTNSYVDVSDSGWLANASIPTSAPDITDYSYSFLVGVSRVEPVFVPAGDDGVGTTPKRTVVRVYYGDESVDINLQKVLNQSGWNGGTQANVAQAVSDIMSW